MAEIELAPLSHRLDDDEMKTLGRLLEEAGVPRIGKADEHSTHTTATDGASSSAGHHAGPEIGAPNLKCR